MQVEAIDNNGDLPKWDENAWLDSGIYEWYAVPTKNVDWKEGQPFLLNLWNGHMVRWSMMIDNHMVKNELDLVKHWDRKRQKFHLTQKNIPFIFKEWGWRFSRTWSSCFSYTKLYNVLLDIMLKIQNHWILCGNLKFWVFKLFWLLSYHTLNNKILRPNIHKRILSNE